MKLIAQVKLQPTEQQADALLDTLEKANAACNYISDVAWDTKTFMQYDLHHACYYPVREKFGLSAQVTIRAEAKVADAYKLDRKHKRTFKEHGSIAYDERILSWRMGDQTVNIWTMSGRQRMPFLAGERQLQLLEHRQGQADLILRDGEWYLHQICEVTESDEFDPTGWLGVDLGVVNIAVTSDGDIFSGEKIESKRQWYEHRRAVLQSVGTKSAKRRLRQLSGRQQRFQRDTNHCISKTLVETAKGTERGIALENLKGIRSRQRLRHGQRSRHHNWAFAELRAFVSYKAALSGVPIEIVDPAYTSQTCPLCGHVSRSNRKSQSEFCCGRCEYVGLADYIAAQNIAGKGAVNAPTVSTDGNKGLSANCVTT
uniref:Putative transposase n=1 Tax=viral metagenome TaxID=1070528 RepID=A0A6M3LU36_9ZZZZ